jgi:hypothetical protein
MRQAKEEGKTNFKFKFTLGFIKMETQTTTIAQIAEKLEMRSLHQ